MVPKLKNLRFEVLQALVSIFEIINKYCYHLYLFLRKIKNLVDSKLGQVNLALEENATGLRIFTDSQESHNHLMA